MSLKTWAIGLVLRGKLPNWAYALIGKKIAKVVNLQEGNMDTKKWYQSRNVWTGVVTVLIGLYTSVDVSLGTSLGFDLPNIPEFVFVILGTLGVYTRVTTTKTIE